MDESVVQNARILVIDDEPANLKLMEQLRELDLPGREIERARKAGFIEYLTKPLDLARLLAILDKLLSEREHNKAVENSKVAGHV